MRRDGDWRARSPRGAGRRVRPAPSVTAANLPKEADRAFAIVVIRADAALAVRYPRSGVLRGKEVSEIKKSCLGNDI